MAKFNVVGFEQVERALLRREQAAAAAVPEMLKAGAAVLVRAQQDEAVSLDLVDYGDFRDSIKPTPIRKSGAEATVEVYPQGVDRKGVRNATKGFVAEYGRSNMPARPWMSAANAKCADEVHQAMLEVWEAKQNG